MAVHRAVPGWCHQPVSCPSSLSQNFLPVVEEKEEGSSVRLVPSSGRRRSRGQSGNTAGRSWREECSHTNHHQASCSPSTTTFPWTGRHTIILPPAHRSVCFRPWFGVWDAQWIGPGGAIKLGVSYQLTMWLCYFQGWARYWGPSNSGILWSIRMQELTGGNNVI